MQKGSTTSRRWDGTRELFPVDSEDDARVSTNYEVLPSVWYGEAEAFPPRTAAHGNSITTLHLPQQGKRYLDELVIDNILPFLNRSQHEDAVHNGKGGTKRA